MRLEISLAPPSSARGCDKRKELKLACGAVRRREERFGRLVGGYGRGLENGAAWRHRTKSYPPVTYCRLRHC